MFWHVILTDLESLYVISGIISQVFSTAGGTAFNGVVEELKKLTTRVAHVLPVSDDGGSTAEIVRVLGLSNYTTWYYYFNVPLILRLQYSLEESTLEMVNKI